MSRLLIIVALILGGCATEPQILRGSGKEIPPPSQWQIMCFDQPWLEICRPEVSNL